MNEIYTGDLFDGFQMSMRSLLFFPENGHFLVEYPRTGEWALLSRDQFIQEIKGLKHERQ